MQTGGATRSQQETVADLRSGGPDRMVPALAEMVAIPPPEWGVELRGALLDALTREIEEKAFGDDLHAAFYPMFELAIRIAALGDVRAAPVLARHGGFGWRQRDLLVSLGEPGLRALLEFAPETRPYGNGTNLDHVRVLAALHLYLYERGVDAVDAETLTKGPRVGRTRARRAGQYDGAGMGGNGSGPSGWRFGAAFGSRGDGDERRSGEKTAVRPRLLGSLENGLRAKPHQARSKGSQLLVDGPEAYSLLPAPGLWIRK